MFDQFAKLEELGKKLIDFMDDTKSALESIRTANDLNSQTLIEILEIMENAK